MFADVRALNRPHADEADDEAGLRQPAGAPARLPALARRRRPRACPTRFVAHLRARARPLRRSTASTAPPALEEACYRLFLSQQRAATARAAVVSILERRLEQVARWPEQRARTSARCSTSSSPRWRAASPVVADLAREVRYRYFDEPVIAAAREASTTEMEAHVAALAERIRAADRDERIAALVDCPQPLASLLSARMRRRPPAGAASRRWRAATTGCARSRPSSAAGRRRPVRADRALPVRGPPPPPRGCLRRARRRRPPRCAPSPPRAHAPARRAACSPTSTRLRADARASSPRAASTRRRAARADALHRS